MSLYIHTRYDFTCNKCGAITRADGYDVTTAMSILRSKGWLIIRKKRDDPTYEIGRDNHRHYCPDCWGKV